MLMLPLRAYLAPVNTARTLIPAGRLVALEGAGREGFEPSREFHTPYPLSRRALSTTQPPPRNGAANRFYPAGGSFSPVDRCKYAEPWQRGPPTASSGCPR